MVQETESNLIIINDVLKLCADISSLYLNNKFSDVILNVGGEQIYAHKAILAARSEGMAKMLFEGDDLKEYVLTEGSPEAYKVLLKYVYTGTLSLSKDSTSSEFEVLGLLHRYQFTELQKPLSNKIKAILNLKNVFKIVDIANLYNLTDLVESCNSFLDTQAEKLKSNKELYDLSQTSMIKLLQRDTFILPEDKIFNLVLKWRDSNTDLDDSVLNCVRLSQMTVKDIICTVWPTKTIHCDRLLSAIAEIIDVKPRTTTRRIPKEVNKNFATVDQGSDIIFGGDKLILLNKVNPDSSEYSSPPIGDKKGITIKLGATHVVNHIKFKLYDGNRRHYKYYIEVSVDGILWKEVIDYKNYPCRSIQNLYFKPTTVQFIRVIGTYNSANAWFHMLTFETYFTSSIPKLHNGIVVPQSNVALSSEGAIVLEGDRPENIIDGHFTNYEQETGFTFHEIGSGSIIIELAQPYMISKMKLLLWDKDDRVYKYYIETSSNNVDWEMAVDHKNIESKSWQEATFSSRITVFVKITGTSNTANDNFHCVYFECCADAADLL